MARGLRHIRTMRGVWDERRKGSPRPPERPSIVRLLPPARPARRRPPPEGTVAPRAWVFSKKPQRQTATRPDRQLLVKRTREPQVDVFDEEEELIVLADVPGVSEDHVRISVEKDLIIIEAVSTGPPVAIHYYTEALLPYEADDHFSLSCRNGVLEAHLRPKPRAADRPSTQDESESSAEAPQTAKTRRQESESRTTKARKNPKRKP